MLLSHLYDAGKMHRLRTTVSIDNQSLLYYFGYPNRWFQSRGLSDRAGLHPDQRPGRGGRHPERGARGVAVRPRPPPLVARQIAQEGLRRHHRAGSVRRLHQRLASRSLLHSSKGSGVTFKYDEP